MWYIKSIVLCQWGQTNCNNLNVGQKLFVLEMLLIDWGIWHVDPLFSTTSLNKYCEHKSYFFPCRDSLLSCILFFIPITFKNFVISTTLYLYFVWLSVWGMHHFATGLWGSHCSCDNHPQKSNLWLCGDSQCSTLSI